MGNWKETRATIRRFLGRRPLLALGAGTTVLALGLRALAHFTQAAPIASAEAAAAPSTAPACPPRSLSDAGVCVPAPHPETAIALAESPGAEPSHDSLTPGSEPLPAAPHAPGEPEPASTAGKLEFEPVDTTEDDEKPRRALRESPPEFERGTPEEPPEELPEEE